MTGPKGQLALLALLVAWCALGCGGRADNPGGTGTRGPYGGYSPGWGGGNTTANVNSCLSDQNATVCVESASVRIASDCGDYLFETGPCNRGAAVGLCASKTSGGTDVAVVYRGFEGLNAEVRHMSRIYCAAEGGSFQALNESTTDTPVHSCYEGVVGCHELVNLTADDCQFDGTPGQFNVGTPCSLENAVYACIGVDADGYYYAAISYSGDLVPPGCTDDSLIIF